MKRFAALILSLLILLPIVSACAVAPETGAAAAVTDGVKAWFTALVESDDAPFSFVLDGVSSREFLHRWKKKISRDPVDGKDALTVTYASRKDGLECTLTATFPSGFDSVEWVVRMTNTGRGNSARISRFSGADVVFGLPAPADGYVMNTSHGCRDSQIDDYKDFSLRTFPLSAAEGASLRPQGGRSSSHAWPFFDVLGDGCGVMAALGWTGQWQCDFTVEDAGVRMQAGQQDLDAYLYPDEQIRTPSCSVTYFEGDAAQGHNLLRRLILAEYTPENVRQDGIPISINCWGGRTAEYLESRIDMFERYNVAAENLWVDAAWFGDFELVDGLAGIANDGTGWSSQVGTWTPNRNLWPDGNARAVSDYCHENGYSFTLWCEPERAYQGSDMYVNHRGLFFEKEMNGSILFNLSTEEGYAWMEAFLTGFIEDNGVDVYRQDFNIEPLEIWRANDEEGRAGMTEQKYIVNLYRLFDALLEKFPGLTIDNCASGGRRIDLETLRRSVNLWRSDYQCWAYPTFQIEGMQAQTQGYIYWLPLSATGAGSGYSWFDPYFFRSLLSQGVSMVDTVGQNPGIAKKRVEELNLVRPYFYGDYYSLIEPVFDAVSWQAYSLMLDEGRDGVAVVYTRELTKEPTRTIALRGLVESAQYTVTDMDTGETVAAASGGELMDGGLTLTLEPRAAKVYFIKAA